MRNPELEAEIIASNHDTAAYLVYADWLQANGDPRGELIVRTIRDRDAAIYMEENRRQLLGPFATFDGDLRLEWRNGFVKTASIGWPVFSGEDQDDPSEDQLAAFFALDVCSLLENLTVGPSPDEDQMSLDRYADVIANAGLRQLRTLDLGERGDWDISSTSTKAPPAAGLPALRELTLHAGDIALGEAIAYPRLTKLAIQTGQLTAEQLHVIARAELPSLEELDLWFGDPHYGATGDVDDIAPLFQRRDLPHLRTLRLRNCPFADALVTHLATTPLLAQITSLDLGMGNLSDDGVRAMHAQRDRFRHLQHLVLDDNALTDETFPIAKELAANLVFGNEHDPDRATDLYVSVGE